MDQLINIAAAICLLLGNGAMFYAVSQAAAIEARRVSAGICPTQRMR